MITIITSTANHPDALVDQRFSRCEYFVIYDDIQKTTHYIPNPFKDNIEHTGPEVVNLIGAYKPARVISGEFGSKVKPLLDRLKIQMIVINGEQKTINDIIHLINKAHN
jgi:predicted Fe-Mo cluster-binding NifX family protein